MTDGRSGFPVIDGHVDLLYRMIHKWPARDFEDVAEDHVTPLGMMEGNVRVMVSAIYCEDAANGAGRALPNLQHLLHYAERHLRAIPLIRTRKDLEGCYLGTGSPGSVRLLENADALADGDTLDLKAAGFVAVGLTHAGRNRLGDGNNVGSPGGLTSMGRRVVRALDREGLVLDVAHLSEPGFWEVVDLFQGPLISSHTGFRTFCDLPRNLSDGQVEVLMARKGMLGVSVNPDMLASDARATIRDVFEQTDWVVQKHGVEGVALGSDFGGFDGTNLGLEHIGRMESLAHLFGREGYPDRAIAAILGDNWYRLYVSTLPSADPPPH